MAGRSFRLIFRPRPFSLTEHVKPFSFLSFLVSLSLHFVVPFLVLHLQLSFFKLGLADLSAQPTLHDFLKTVERSCRSGVNLRENIVASEYNTVTEVLANVLFDIASLGDLFRVGIDTFDLILFKSLPFLPLAFRPLA